MFLFLWAFFFNRNCTSILLELYTFQFKINKQSSDWPNVGCLESSFFSQCMKGIYLCIHLGVSFGSECENGEPNSIFQLSSLPMQVFLTHAQTLSLSNFFNNRSNSAYSNFPTLYQSMHLGYLTNVLKATNSNAYLKWPCQEANKQ